VSDRFWQAKIWGLLHDSPLKPLQRSKKGDGPWERLKVMASWKEFTQSPRHEFTWIKQADLIASASDRAAIGSLPKELEVNYEHNLELRHLLSGQKLEFELPLTSKLHKWRELPGDQGKGDERKHIKQLIIDTIPQEIRNSDDPQEVFWWLWRCLPDALSRHPDIDDPILLLIPAETRIPDCSIWSHNSMTAGLAGSLMGYDGSNHSHPYVVTLTFTPVQEIVKASRKMQDFWAGSWILHYLSASICWALAKTYGPDSLIYPSLYAQPLIDHWLLNERYPEAQYPHWHKDKLIQKPDTRQLLTAGFPNVIVLVLPEGKVKAAVDLARRLLTGEDPQIPSPWMNLAEKVKKEVFQGEAIASTTWENWLKAQWQVYWTALPLGDPSVDLTQPTTEGYEDWAAKQNNFAGRSQRSQNLIFESGEGTFLKRKVGTVPPSTESRLLHVNVGSWWAPVFDQVRISLTSVKNARTWVLPTAFGMRSTISGLGPVVRGESKEGKRDWAYADQTENDDDSSPLQRFWRRQRGLFNGSEKLNATEVVKRGLERVLKQHILCPGDDNIPTYPDLTVGVAGWLKRHPEAAQTYQNTCHTILESCDAIASQEKDWADQAASQRWGIPWIDESTERRAWKHPRLLSPSWLTEDFEPDTSQPLTKREKQKQIQGVLQALHAVVDSHFPNNNPTDWYVLASGDGDGMGDWLRGDKMQPYQDYVQSDLLRQTLPEADQSSLENFLEQKKRMGPATHAALSRALLDFSNQLVPYLTEKRYAGRLIYSGGDDVLAYNNLWEWDDWLWDIHQCFQGAADPEVDRLKDSDGNLPVECQYFQTEGGYWSWKGDRSILTERPLFTMGCKASISFGITIAHHSVPLAIALENLWDAEKEAKKHVDANDDQKDAVQVRVLYGNGNILKATSKFEVFNLWRSLLTLSADPALFEQAAETWKQHPIPVPAAINVWTKAFCDRRDALSTPKLQQEFHKRLSQFIDAIWKTSSNAKERDRQIEKWLKLTAFLLRNRNIKIPATEVTPGEQG